jgi:hypothetical protein
MPRRHSSRLERPDERNSLLFGAHVPCEAAARPRFARRHPPALSWREARHRRSGALQAQVELHRRVTRDADEAPDAGGGHVEAAPGEGARAGIARAASPAATGSEGVQRELVSLLRVVGVGGGAGAVVGQVAISQQ